MTNVELSDDLSDKLATFTGGSYTRETRTHEVFTGTIKSLAFRVVSDERRLELKRQGSWCGEMPFAILPELCTAELDLDGALIIEGQGMILTLLPEAYVKNMKSFEEQFDTTDY